MARESENSRYLRSTISNIAFLVAIGYFVHEKALSETSLVTIVTLFIGGYFGVRAYAHKADADVTVASMSNPRFPAQRPPDDPPFMGGSDIHTQPTRQTKMPIPRTDDTPTDPQGRGKWGPSRRWIFELLPIGLPILVILIGMALYGAMYFFKHNLDGGRILAAYGGSFL